MQSQCHDFEVEAEFWGHPNGGAAVAQVLGEGEVMTWANDKRFNFNWKDIT
jgi:hypothetical protein